MIMVTKERSYVYTGKIDAEHIANTFISNEKYREHQIHGGKGYTTKRVINEGRGYIEREMERKEMALEALQPWVIDDIFAYMFADLIGSMFY